MKIRLRSDYTKEQIIEVLRRHHLAGFSGRDVSVWMGHVQSLNGENLEFEVIEEFLDDSFDEFRVEWNGNKFGFFYFPVILAEEVEIE